MAEKYIVIFPDNTEILFEKDVNGVVDIYEPDPRNMQGACYFVVNYDNKRSVRYMNLPYITTSTED